MDEAIRCSGVGTLNKIFGVYSHAWWNDEPYASVIKKGVFWWGADATDVTSHTAGMFQTFTTELDGISLNRKGEVETNVCRMPILNLHAMTDQPALAAYVACKAATTIEGMQDAEVGDLLHRTLTRSFGTEPPRPVAVHVTRWAQDPYARGSYSHMITGVSEVRHREAFQKPIAGEEGAVLLFAGEHCSRDHFAYAHGALMDGWRAADAILQET